MSEDTKTVEMYAYFGNGQELWTSNPTFAEVRSKFYGTNKVYVEVVTVEEEKN